MSLQTMRVTSTLFIDEKEIDESFIRSSGPGGQNVNKVATAVQLRFDVLRSPSLTEEVRARLLLIVRSKLTKEGVLVITAQRYRSQEQNRQDARRRLADIIYRATIKPKKRIPSKPTKASKEDRLAVKAHHSQLKQGRRLNFEEDD
jgi:ribosome-associated protein